MDFESSSRSKSHRRHGWSSSSSSSSSVVPSFPYSPHPSSSSSYSFASSSSSFSPTFLSRTNSPPRVRMGGHSSPSSRSIRFSIDNRPTSPGRSISVANSPICRREVRAAPPMANGKKTCMCSPTTHPGSFRCSLHKNLGHGQGQGQGHGQFSSSQSLNFRRSAMTNSLVRIGGVEGDLVKRALAALIRPSSHQMRRRVDFRPRPSRLSVMCRAVDP